MKCFVFFLLLLFSMPLFPDGYCSGEELMRDLMVVDCINRRLCDRFPVTYNHLLQGGYFNMPSARMEKEGDVAFGYSYVPPYRNINVRFQVFPHVEITGNYRIFCNVPDPVFGHMGFGDLADKGANIKFALITPEESDYCLPGFAFGWDDFLGTRGFKAKYIVMTQVFPKLNFELSFGWGQQRIHGFFGGALWAPFRCSHYSLLNNLTVSAEYDAIQYSKPRREPHPDGRNQSSHINWGVKTRLWNVIDISASSIRGKEFAFAASFHYNFGETEGFLSKIDDPLPYSNPVKTEPLNCLRPEEILFTELSYALEEQGFYLLEARLEKTTLRIKLYNCKWLLESCVKKRLNALLSRLVPSNFDCVIVTMTSEGFPIQEYRYQGCFLEAYRYCRMCDYEINLLTPRKEACWPYSPSDVIFIQNRKRFCWDLLPKTKFLFGSSRGKFKSALGVNFGGHGYLWGDIYYKMLFGYLPYNSIDDVSDRDILNPSQLINVRTDAVLYYKYKRLTVDQAYLQKNLQVCGPLYARFSGGYFSQMYGGAATEWLLYPTSANWAIGIDAAYLQKRKISGLGFTSTIRKLQGTSPTYETFHGSQYFIDLYYTLTPCQLDLKASLGKFLAGDTGIRYEVSRYFKNGFRAGLWYSVTNANDRINDSIYRDKGIFFSLPLDIFYTYSCRRTWEYGMAAWLRDSAYRTYTGQGLYDLIRSHRF